MKENWVGKKSWSRAGENPVLLVSNDKTTSKLIKVCFSLEGITVESSFDAEEATQRVKEKEFGLVLIDFDQQGKRGNELCRAIKRLAANLPVMAIAEVPSLVSNCFERVHKKPFRIQEIIHSVHQTLAGEAA